MQSPCVATWRIDSFYSLSASILAPLATNSLIDSISSEYVARCKGVHYSPIVKALIQFSKAVCGISSENWSPVPFFAASMRKAVFLLF